MLIDNQAPQDKLWHELYATPGVVLQLVQLGCQKMIDKILQLVQRGCQKMINKIATFATLS
jgi:hypothetical protein